MSASTRKAASILSGMRPSGLQTPSPPQATIARLQLMCNRDRGCALTSTRMRMCAHPPTALSAGWPHIADSVSCCKSCTYVGAFAGLQYVRRMLLATCNACRPSSHTAGPASPRVSHRQLRYCTHAALLVALCNLVPACQGADILLTSCMEESYAVARSACQWGAPMACFVSCQQLRAQSQS